MKELCKILGSTWLLLGGIDLIATHQYIAGALITLAVMIIRSKPREVTE